MIDVAHAIDAEAISITWRRRMPGSYDDDGEAVDGSEQVRSIRAAVQPMSLERYGSVLKDVIEGARTEALWMVWTREDIGLDDVLIIGGIPYRVMFTWPRHDGGYVRAAVGRVRP